MKKKSRHIKTGDKVVILAGNHKGLLGTILSVNPKKNTLFLDNVLPRILTKKTALNESEKVQIQEPINISNVMLWDEKANHGDTIGYKLVDNKKVRFFRKSGNILNVPKNVLNTETEVIQYQKNNGK